jgi:hypothetical protein
MEMREWADACGLIMQSYSNIMRLDGDDWRSWGLSIMSSPQLGKFDMPNPYSYHDWRDWADNMTVTLQSATEAPGKGTH